MTSVRTVARRAADPVLTRIAHRAAALTPRPVAEPPDDVTVELLHGPAARLNDRRVTRGQMADLAAQVAAVAGVEDPAPHLAQAYRLLAHLESGGIGRLAGTTSNILGKLTTAPLLLGAGPQARVLEIGTLFGLFAAGLHRQLLRYGREHSLVVVDPLEAVQLQPERPRATDPSGTPVTESTVRANLRFAGVDPAAVTVHRGVSTDPAVRGTVGGPYDLVVIDGDHSREGVAADLAWVETIAAPGAVVVMDDYGDPGWPGVSQALDDHLAAGSSMQFLGAVSTSAFLRMP
ncbi:class I SAM-dependent methyltransferase [Trujillonella humicola]|uniref:class I SAM-dependent methyltransferase n=1 Tax=Trujillonella humicola TaxID=3383699 RepID=UPI0039058F96